jgi:dihydropteroate synthase
MFTLNCKGSLLKIDDPVVMGIINITPDSFYTGSRIKDKNDLLGKVEQMIREGATILDIGGQSTRPGSEILPVEEELKRSIPAIELINEKYPETIISIDTFYSRVAREAISAGAHIINDVSGGTIDEELIQTVAELKVPYVLMHMKGTPQNMHLSPEYDNVTLEVFDYLNFKVHHLIKAGINDIIIDPGFGFGKTSPHNFELIRNLKYLKELNKPLLVGISRKGTIYKTLNTTAEGALNGTTVMNTIALMNGADILRVHDVKEAMEAITLFKSYKKEQH